MSINKENILSVSAEGAGISQNFVVQRQGRLTADEKRRYLEGEEVKYDAVNLFLMTSIGSCQTGVRFHNS